MWNAYLVLSIRRFAHLLLLSIVTCSLFRRDINFVTLLFFSRCKVKYLRNYLRNHASSTVLSIDCVSFVSYGWCVCVCACALGAVIRICNDDDEHDNFTPSLLLTFVVCTWFYAPFIWFGRTLLLSLLFPMNQYG